MLNSYPSSQVVLCYELIEGISCAIAVSGVGLR